MVIICDPFVAHQSLIDESVCLEESLELRLERIDSLHSLDGSDDPSMFVEAREAGMPLSGSLRLKAVSRATPICKEATLSHQNSSVPIGGLV